MSPSSSSSSSSSSLITRATTTIATAAIVALFLIATLTTTTTTTAASVSKQPLRQQLQVLHFEDLPDLDVEQASELGLDLKLDAMAAKPQTLTLSAVRPSLSVVSEDDTSEFARWMLEDTESTLNFGTGSGDVDASTGEEWVESSSGSSELSSSASFVAESSSASMFESSTGGSSSGSSAAASSSSAGVVVVPASSLVLSSSSVQVHLSYGSVAVTVTSVVGALPMVYSVSPSLPTGLSISASTGAITGTATVLSSATVYTITASNAAIGGGSTTASLTLAVNVHAPVSLTLSSNKVTMASGLHASITSTVVGSPCTFTVAPSLPAGLSLNAATGVISGSPSVAQSAVNYTVNATNAAGSLTARVAITVTSASALPPYGLVYPVMVGQYYVRERMSANIPVVYGAGVFVFSISPAVPSGLTFSYTSGLIKGTPVVEQAATTYTITVTTIFGSVSTAITMAVVPRPPTIVYPVNPVSLVVNSMFSMLPVVAGTLPLTYAITPSLPAGLTFSTESGSIAGAPTATAASATYTVTVSNTGGSATVAVVLMVANVATPPSALSYSPSRVDFPSTVSAVVSPTVLGTTPMVFTVSPALVAGLSLDAVTGVITGTATATTAGDVVYTVTASSNTVSGTASATVTVSVTVVPVARLVYASRFGRFIVGTAISDVPLTYPVVGTSAAGDLTFTTSALPAGLSLNSSTGELSGTPTETSEAVTYTITASNSQGSLTQSVQIRVVAATAAPPARQATVALSLPGLTPATFTPELQTSLLQEFADRLGLAVANLRLQTFTSSAHAFVVQADTLAVRIIIDLDTGDDATSGDASAVTAYLNEQLEADEFSLASFPGMGIDTDPAPFTPPSSSSTGGVDSDASSSGSNGASTGAAVEVGDAQSVNNTFKWSSLGGTLLIVFIVLLAVVLLLLLFKFVMSRRRSPHEKLYADHEQVQTVVIDSGAGAGAASVPLPTYGSADASTSLELTSGAFGGVAAPVPQAAERRGSAAGFHYSDAV